MKYKQIKSRTLQWGLVLALGCMVGPLTTSAWAHGGQYQNPGGTTARPSGTPRGGGITPGLSPTWQNWWFHNREEFLDVRARRIAQREHDGQYETRGHKGATRRQVRIELIPTILKALKDNSADVRDAACIALGRMGDAPEVDHLQKMIGDRNPSVREAAIMGLGLLRNPKSEAALVKILKTPATRAKERGMAAIALGLSGGRRARSALQERLGKQLALPGVSSVKQRQLEGCRALGMALIGAGESVDLVSGAYRKGTTKQDNFRPMALTALARLGDPVAGTMVMAGLSSRHREDRRSAAILAGRAISGDQTREVRRLISALKGERDEFTRHFMAISLGRLATDDSLDFLRQSFAKASHREERAFAAIALGVAKHAESVPLLLKGLTQEKDISLRSASAIALGMMDDDSNAPKLHEEMGKTKNPLLRAHIITALAMLEYQPAREDIRKLIVDARNPRLIRACGFALALMRDMEAIDLMIDVLRSSGSLSVKGGMASALGRIGDKRVIEDLVKVLKTPAETDMTRAFAVVALGLVGDKSQRTEFSRISIDSNYSLLNCEALMEVLDIF